MRYPTIIVLILLLNAFAVQAQDAAIGGDLGLYSRYVWRGLVFDDQPVLQTDLWMEVHGITMSFWGNMSLTDQGDEFEGQFNEWDVYIVFPFKSWELMTIGGEVDYLSFPSASGFEGAATAELSAWIAGNIFGSPTLQVFWDVWQLHGVYTNLSFSHTQSLGPGELNLSTGLGWGSEGHNLQGGAADAAGLLDLQAAVGYTYAVQDWLVIQPGIQFTSLLQPDIRDYYDSADLEADNLLFSVNCGLVLPGY